MMDTERRIMDTLLDYEGLVYSIINKYKKRFDIDDLYQVAMIGLIDAYKHYDHKKESKFSSFAYYYILGEVNKYIRNSSSLKVSDQIIKLKSRILKAKEVMTQKLGREPSNLELSLYLDVEEELINQALLSDEVKEIEDNDIFHYDETSPDVLDLKEELSKLEEDEKKIIYARYYNELTQSETSNLLGISQTQVSRCENKILQKLRTNL